MTATVAVIALIAAVVIAIVSWRSQQRTVRRVVDVVERMGESSPPKLTSESAFARLERSVDRARRHDDDARVAEVRIERAFSEITQALVVCDTNGDIVLRNAFAQAFAEARHGEALVEAAIQESLEAALRGERPEHELEIHGPPPRTLYVHAAPLHDHSMLIGAIAIVDDITDQQRIDTIRRDFVANVSHELKTPIGALALLAETLADETDPQIIQRLSGRIRDESFRVSRMVDDLLTLSRIEGRDAPVVEIVRVTNFVHEAVERVAHAAEHRGVSIDCAPIDPSLTLAGDQGQLTSALFNLLDNAVKYSEPGSVVEVSAHATAGELHVAVQDHGIGIPSRDLERIFERFYRVDKARSRDTGGTGLGLSIVRHIARNHSGDVSVVSHEGEGSTFTIVLPLYEARLSG